MRLFERLERRELLAVSMVDLQMLGGLGPAQETPNARVDAVDMIRVRDNQTSFGEPADILNPFDFDRDERVNATDFLICRDNQTNMRSELQLITAPGVDAKAADLLYQWDWGIFSHKRKRDPAYSIEHAVW